jgi:hypothetical protein
LPDTEFFYLHRRDMGMATDYTNARWFKSSASSVTGCVEVAHLPNGLVALRDSKDVSKVPHVFNRHEWAAFLAGVRKGEFDLPAR